MPGLSNQDLKDVLLVTQTALECNEIDELRREVLSQLERIFKCNKVTFFLADESRKNLDWKGVITRNIDGKLMDQYGEYYHQLDPHVIDLAYKPPAVQTEEIISFQDLTRSEYYNDFLRRLDIHFQVTMILRSGPRVLAALGLLRPKQACNFSEIDKTKVEMIAPYLVEVLEKDLLLDEFRKRAATLESVAMDLPYKGKIILDESLKPLHMDESAHKLITDLNQGERQQDEKNSFLPDEIYRRCESLRETARLRKKQELAQDRFDLDIGPGQAVSVLLRLINNPNKPLGFLVCIEPGRNATFALPLDCRLSEHNLSPREREVAYLVCQGLRNSEVSEKLYISRYTVENHLKSIFEKLRVNSRTRLVHKLIQFM